MAEIVPFTVIRRGETPEEAFEKAKADGFANNVHGKDYMVYVELPKRTRPYKYVNELLDTNVFLQAQNGPVGCVLARASGWVNECHVVDREAKNEVVYLGYDNRGKELFSCSDEKIAVLQARQWALDHETKVSVGKQIRITEKVIECQALPENHLNAYWFFGWALA